MNSELNRRSFGRLCAALAAWLGRRPGDEAKAAPQASRGATRSRKNFVAIQVQPFAWVDEGIDRLLDNLQEKGNVNTVFVYTYDYHTERITKGGPTPLPDHGAYGSGAPRPGGAYFDYDLKYFGNTILKDFRSPELGKFNVITEVAPKMKARGMDFFAWDYSDAFPVMMRSVPNFAKVTEVDIHGRRTGIGCFNNPDYRAHLMGKIEAYLNGYASEVNGIAWGCERMGPFHNAIGGPWTTPAISCFCEHCRKKARERDVSVDRAQRGYLQLQQLIQAAHADQRPVDGYFVSFWRLLLEFPEILSWEKLWTDSYHDVRSELYGVAKGIAPAKPFGFHIMQNVTFSPFYRAEEDYAHTRNYADFLKLATYNNAAGPRMARYLDRLHASIFHDAGPKDFLPFYYKMMNYEEKSYDEIVTGGLSADYVARETRRAIAGTGGGVKIYPGIDIDVPTKLTGEKRTSPEDVRASVRAAFSAGADGVVLSREYTEMRLANLSAAGETLREVFANAGN